MLNMTVCSVLTLIFLVLVQITFRCIPRYVTFIDLGSFLMGFLLLFYRKISQLGYSIYLVGQMLYTHLVIYI